MRIHACARCGRATIEEPACSICCMEIKRLVAADRHQELVESRLTARWLVEQAQARKATNWGAKPVTPRDVADQLGVTWDEKTEGAS